MFRFGRFKSRETGNPCLIGTHLFQTTFAVLKWGKMMLLIFTNHNTPAMLDFRAEWKEQSKRREACKVRKKCLPNASRERPSREGSGQDGHFPEHFMAINFNFLNMQNLLTQAKNPRTNILWLGKINSLANVFTTTIVPPTQRPTTKRAASNNCQLGANADANVAKMNPPRTSNETGFRPMASENAPKLRVPTRTPTNWDWLKKNEFHFFTI